MKKLFKILLIGFLALTIIGFISGLLDNSNAPKTPADQSSTESSIKSELPVNKTEVQETKWIYSEDVDKMTDKKIYYAQIDANELLQFDFPYNGGVTATLTIRNKSGVNEAILSITKGQFLPNTLDDETISVRFDSKPAQKFSYSNAADGSTETIFIANKGKFIKQLKESKKLIVQCEFYDNGLHTMEFDTDKFIWKH